MNAKSLHRYVSSFCAACTPQQTESLHILSGLGVASTDPPKVKKDIMDISLINGISYTPHLKDMVGVGMFWFKCKIKYDTEDTNAQLTVRNSSAGLTLQPQRRPKAGAIVEAPTLLHFGRAAAHQLGPSHHLVAGGTALAVVDGHLPALHALTTRARHPDALLKTQLLTAGMKKRRRRRKRRDGDGGRPVKEARLMEVMIQRVERDQVYGETECVDRDKTHT